MPRECTCELRKSIENFTDFYWMRILERYVHDSAWQAEAPNYGTVLNDIIATRVAFCVKLRNCPIHGNQ